MAGKRRSESKGKAKAPPHAWKPGQSGNPGGRPPLTEAQRLAREARARLQPELVEALAAIALSPAEKASDRIAAARALLEELPKVDADGKAAEALTVIVRTLGEGAS